MNKKILIAVVAITGVAILYYILNINGNKREPIILTSNASYAEMSLDTLITEADLIVIGSVDKVHPSRWNTPSGKLPKGITVHTITPDKVIFTDVNFSVDQILKGQSNQKTVRIRSLGGVVGQDQMIVSGVASLEIGNTYLLFLGKDTGSTADITPGHYFVRGGLQGLYQISEGKATSFRDEWLLEELIAYIEKSLSGQVSLPTPTPIPTESLIETPLPFTDTPVATDLPIQTPFPTETTSPTP